MSISFETLALAKSYTDKHGGGGGTGKDLGVTGATVGQIIVVKTVDANGKPTSWEPVDQIDVDNIIDVSDNQPLSSDNKMWLLETTPQGIEIPTYDEFATLEDSIATEYDPTASYAVGDFCLKDQILYKSNTPIPAGGEAWDATHWTRTQIINEFGSGGGGSDIGLGILGATVGQIIKVRTVNASGKPTSWEVIDSPVYPISITVTTNPTKMSYGVGESFDKTGMVATITRNNATTVAANNSDISFSPASFAAAGNTTVTLTWTKDGYTFTTTLSVTVGASVIKYGFHIDSSESDPSAAVTYLEDAIGKTPAYMDFANDTFVWGGWENAFFLPRPCMLKYDGTVDYYLDPNDYSKKADGVTPSDVANVNYAGNAMVEWGQNDQKIYYKIVPDNDPTGASIYIANTQVDAGYHAYSFINNQGQEVDHFYTPMFNGSLDSSGRLRSIGGIAKTSLTKSKTAEQEITAAEKNNPSTDKLWYTEVYADIVLINLLLILISKSLNSQGAFGNGVISGNEAGMVGTGTLNDKGMFYGTNIDAVAVKIFHMENWWGNQWRRFAGLINVSGTQKFKMTRTTDDGSTVADYNLTGQGYLTGATYPSANGTYIKKMTWDDKQWISSLMSGTDSTFYCDGLWTNNAQTDYAFRGGNSSSGARCGAWCLDMNDLASFAYWSAGAAPSCKPLS